MPTPTYDLIASNVVSSAVASVTFSSIPSTYRDLVIVMNPLVSTAGNGLLMRFNSDSGGNYQNLIMRGNGSATSAFGYTNQTSVFITFGAVDNVGTITTASIFDYNQTDKHKSVLARHNSVTSVVEQIGARWANTAAINNISIIGNGVNITAGSSFYLYGIVG
jgi:hypothetical protein